MRAIVTHPDPILHLPAQRVERFGDSLSRLAAEMLETMYAAHGVGLAAPQIGVSLRLAVIDLSFGGSLEAVLVLVNPWLAEATGEQSGPEGCLSLPGISIAESKRAQTVTVRYQNLKGESVERKADGLLARAMQHEIDHLNGKLLA